MSTTLRVGVIGVGVGQAHIVGYQAHPNAEVVAIADLSSQRLAETGDRYGIPDRYTDYHDMLRRDDIEAVSVAVPNALHAPVSLDALQAGKHVLCEKPLALNATEAQRIVDAAAAAGRQVMVCFNYRMRPDARWLKTAVDEGRFGEVYLAKANWLRNSGIPGSGSWFGSRALSGGGPLIDLGVHMLDLSLWLLGYPDAATVSGVTFSKFGPRGRKSWSGLVKSGADDNFDVEDLALALVRFTDGRALTLETSWASHTRSGRDDYFITLYGEEAGADLYVANYAEEDTVMFYTEMFGEQVDIRPKLRGGVRSHTLAVAHFVDSILAGTPVEATGEQGVALMRIIDAIYESARLGREVALAGQQQTQAGSARNGHEQYPATELAPVP